MIGGANIWRLKNLIVQCIGQPTQMITSGLYIQFKSQLHCDKSLCVWTEMEINFVSDFLSLPLGYLLTCLSPFAFYSPGSGSHAL